MARRFTPFTAASDHRPTAAIDWAFPFPPPGRRRPEPAGSIAPATAFRWPFGAVDATPIPPRPVRAPLPLADFVREVATWCDDVAVVSIDDPALAHERDEILYVYPHARSLVCMIAEENRAAMQSRYLPSANHELYSCEERLFAMGHRTVRFVQSLGGEGLTTTIGWPQEVSQRWADKIWPLSHKLVAQAAGLGVIGTSRNFLHKRFGAYCLIDTVLTNLEWPADAYARPIDWNPCLACNLCVASCPTEAIHADGTFDFFACYNHTYRDSIPGFLDLVGDLAERSPRAFRKRWADNEIAALWQAMAFKVEYRCFNCVATCPAEIEHAFHADTAVRRRYLDETLKPLTHARTVEDAQFVLDTPAARARHGIPPGEWRTPVDRAGASWRTVRLVNLRRIRTQNVDAMMRWMPQYFRPTDAAGLDFTTALEFTGPGGGDWTLRVRGGRCEVRPGRPETPDLVVRTDATYWLRVHRSEANSVVGILTGRIRLRGRRRLILAFPALFGHEPGSSWAHRLAFRVRRALRRPAS
jgi:NAD-dependent dihydropyrimidine dehydrogenase PreA subunit/putative sterol carrier protein